MATIARSVQSVWGGDATNRLENRYPAAILLVPIVVWHHVANIVGVVVLDVIFQLRELRGVAVVLVHVFARGRRQNAVCASRGLLHGCGGTLFDHSCRHIAGHCGWRGQVGHGLRAEVFVVGGQMGPSWAPRAAASDFLACRGAEISVALGFALVRPLGMGRGLVLVVGVLWRRGDGSTSEETKRLDVGRWTWRSRANAGARARAAAGGRGKGLHLQKLTLPTPSYNHHAPSSVLHLHSVDREREDWERVSGDATPRQLASWATGAEMDERTHASLHLPSAPAGGPGMEVAFVGRHSAPC
jgi:hypothetical protein